LPAYGPGKTADKKRLSQPGYAFYKKMAARKQGDKGMIYQFGLSDKSFGNFRFYFYKNFGGIRGSKFFFRPS
jgi:hypothetical protein